MFCPKCGCQIDGNVRFCPSCGNTLAPAAPASPSSVNRTYRPDPSRQNSPSGSTYSGPQPGAGYTQRSSVPPRTPSPRSAGHVNPSPSSAVIQEVIGFITAFITPGNQLKALAATLDYRSFGGIIIAAIVSLFSGLCAMVNFNQAAVGILRKTAGSFIKPSYVLKSIPSGANFFLGILSAFMIYLAVCLAVTVAGKLAGGSVSFPSALNLAGYASLPLLAVYILDLLLGLIWFPLPYLLSAVAVLAVFVSVFAALVTRIGAKGMNYILIVVYTAIIVVVTVLFSYMGKQLRQRSCSGYFEQRQFYFGQSFLII